MKQVNIAFGIVCLAIIFIFWVSYGLLTSTVYRIMKNTKLLPSIIYCLIVAGLCYWIGTMYQSYQMEKDDLQRREAEWVKEQEARKTPALKIKENITVSPSS